MTANNPALKGKIALVTGATSPLGRAIALGLANEGADIVAHFHTSARKAQYLCGEIEKIGCSAYPVRADFNREADYGRLIRQAGKCYGRLDILVNNASLYSRTTLDDLSSTDFFTAMRVNAWAPFVLCREFKKAAGRGAIVNLLDSRIVGSDREHAGYSVSKHALNALTRLMALEFAPRIRVNAVAPGLILTGAGEKERYDRMSRALPLQRYGEPEDIARAVLFLAKGPFITGQTLYVDGGRQAREKYNVH